MDYQELQNLLNEQIKENKNGDITALKLKFCLQQIIDQIPILENKIKELADALTQQNIITCYITENEDGTYHIQPYGNIVLDDLPVGSYNGWLTDGSEKNAGFLLVHEIPKVINDTTYIFKYQVLISLKLGNSYLIDRICFPEGFMGNSQSSWTQWFLSSVDNSYDSIIAHLHNDIDPEEPTEEELAAAEQQGYYDGLSGGVNANSYEDGTQLFERYNQGYERGYEEWQTNQNPDPEPEPTNYEPYRAEGYSAGESDSEYGETANPYDAEAGEYWQNGYNEGWTTNPNNQPTE